MDDFVPALNPQGELVRIPAADLQRAMSQGFKPPTPEQLHQLQLEDDAQGFGQGAAAFGEGAASALTFGAAPWIETRLGLTTPEAIAARKEAHPVAHGLGTTAGIVAPLALTFGTAAPVEGAALAGEGAMATARAVASKTAPALITKAARAAGAAVESAGLPGAVGRALPMLAAGAVEGGGFASADVTEKALLGDPQLTWEKAAAEIGMGALLGGTFAGGAHLGAKGLSSLLTKATSGLGTVAEAVASGDEAVVKLMFKSKGAIDALAEAAPNAAEHIAASTPETAQFIIKNAKRIAEMEKGFPGLTEVLARAEPDTADLILKNWNKLLKDPQRRIEVGSALLDATQSTYTKVEQALGKFNREVRPEEAEALLSGPHTVELPGGGSALELVTSEEAEKEGARVATRLRNAIRDMRAEPDLYEPAYVRELEKMRDGLVNTLGGKGEISGIIDTGRGPPQAAPAAIFQRLRVLRQQLDGNIPWDRQISGLAERKSVAAFKELREVVRDSVTGPVWGQAGTRQKALDKAYQEYFDARAQMLRKLGEGPSGAKSISPTKVNAWVNAMADMRGNVKTDAFTEFAEAAKRLSSEMETSGLEGASEIRQQIEAAARTGAEIREKATITQLVKMLQGREILSSGPAVPMGREMLMDAAKRLPGGVGHIIGMAGELNGTISKVRNPARMVGVVSALDRLAKRASGKLDSAADAIFRSGVGGAAAGRSVAGTEHFAQGGVVTPERFADVSTGLRNLGGNLDLLASRVSHETAVLQEHAPSAAAAAHAFAARVVQHLGSKLPDAGGHHLLDAPFDPSDSELAEFNRHHEVAARGPVAVLEHAAAGSLLPEHIEASRALYPSLHAEMQQRVADRLAEHLARGRHVPAELREALGMILDSDLEHATTGAAILSAQSAYASAPQMGPGGGGQRPRNVQTRPQERLATGSQGNELRMGKA